MKGYDLNKNKHPKTDFEKVLFLENYVKLLKKNLNSCKEELNKYKGTMEGNLVKEIRKEKLYCNILRRNKALSLKKLRN